MKVFELSLVLLSVVILAACEENQKQEGSSQAQQPRSQTVQTLEGLRVEYSYGGKYGVIPEKATAFSSTGALVGKAELVEVNPIPGMNVGVYFTIEETHYNPQRSGEIIYKGKYVFSSVHRRKVGEHSIYGSKQFEIFSGWPLPGGF